MTAAQAAIDTEARAASDDVVTGEPRDSEPVIACHECGAVSRIDTKVMRARQVCSGCGGFLRRPRERSIEYGLVLTLGAASLFLVANIFPFLSMAIEGLSQTMFLISAGRALYFLGQPEVGVVVFMATIVLPSLQILANTYVLGSLHLGLRPPGLALVFRISGVVAPWAMLDVFLLGVLVSYVKLLDLAQMEIGEGFYAYIGCLLLLIAAQANLDRFQVWNTIKPQFRLGDLPRSPGQSIWSCHECSQLVLAPERDAQGHPHCPRCRASLHHRKPNSITKTWALLLAATAFYVPANLLPMTNIVSLGSQQTDTILSGVVELLNYGMYPVAALIFIASILVPILKILSLGFLLISVQTSSRWRPRERTRLFRVVELVGRWSMVDIFVISILGALVSLGSLATINPGPAAVAFASVVILTMLAAESFDPRLIWDRSEQDSSETHGFRS